MNAEQSAELENFRSRKEKFPKQADEDWPQLYLHKPSLFNFVNPIFIISILYWMYKISKWYSSFVISQPTDVSPYSEDSLISIYTVIAPQSETQNNET